MLKQIIANQESILKLLKINSTPEVKVVAKKIVKKTAVKRPAPKKAAKKR
ncbi:MAG: hypothetical protein Q7W45_02975 [Bacteroidota bacterium]|nr:hypothetical protein [Bacteroidota bacterium]